MGKEKARARKQKESENTEMIERKYKIMIGAEVVAEVMDIKTTAILLRALFEEYCNDSTLILTIKEMERVEAVKTETAVALRRALEMTDEKQIIDEMQKNLIEIFDDEYKKGGLITAQNTAEKLTAKGYSKQREGKWISKNHSHYCSECGGEHGFAFSKGSSGFFCPQCGAKMKEVRKDD